ncbi:MAG: hypothetical protein P8P30_04280 [Rickettsiales bacterium]|nr:hypothetical protein [Rickettsiales bacterium]
MEAILTPNKPRTSPWKTIGGVITTLLLLIVCAGIYSYVYNQRPDIYKQVLLKLDRMGFTQSAPEELKRVDDINQLRISYEEKQILINKTIFLNASPRMVMLALGNPKEGHRIKNAKTGKKSIILVYHLPEELRPTMLHFEENKLVKAEKGSTIDFATTPVPYTGTDSE